MLPEEGTRLSSVSKRCLQRTRIRALLEERRRIDDELAVELLAAVSPTDAAYDMVPHTLLPRPLARQVRRDARADPNAVPGTLKVGATFYFPRPALDAWLARYRLDAMGRAIATDDSAKPVNDSVPSATTVNGKAPRSVAQLRKELALVGRGR